ncbi:glutamate receptor ionotropic, delta-1-like isoform X2 [Macrobrachium rosenbergii]|uniref:glutamate receptor ionotropic, delta-1-like isoform X2 n=1 Tax=Macrobrachium rosenbergii TaxID=79674 RepID=UPI0034D74908
MQRRGSHRKVVILLLILFVAEVGGQVMKRRESYRFPACFNADIGSDRHSDVLPGKSLSSDKQKRPFVQRAEMKALPTVADFSRTGLPKNSEEIYYTGVLAEGSNGLRKTEGFRYTGSKLNSLHEQQRTEHEDPSTGAVMSVLLSLHLLQESCSFTIFTEQGADEAAGRMWQVLRHEPVKVYDLLTDVLKRRDTWARTICDCYLFFLNEFEDFRHHAAVSHYHQSIHDPQPMPLWNYHAYHFVILPTHRSNMSIGPQDIFSLYNFQKTARVIVFQPEDDYVLVWSHQLYKQGSGLRYLGMWKRGVFRGRLQQLFEKALEDFDGAPLRVAAFDHPPSVVYAYDEHHNIVSRMGVDMQIVKSIAEAMNFTPEFLEVPHDELWGYELPNGTWTGLVGKVFYEHADIGACNVFLELHRWIVVDYSAPYNFERGCFVAPSPKPLQNWKSPVLPFAWDTWISIAVFLLAGGFLSYLIATLSMKPEPREFHSLSYDYLYILAILTMRTGYAVPSHTPLQIYIGFVGILGLIVSTAYSANLVAFLSVTPMSAPIDTMKELSASGLRIGGVAFWKTQFAASIDPVVQNFANVLESDLDFGSLFDRVEAGDFALIENKQYLELQAGARYTYGSRTTIRIVGECLLPYSIGLAFQKNSPLKQVFDGAILRLFESGVVSKWQEEVVDYFRQQYKEKRQQKAVAVQSDNRPLKLEQLQGVFYVLGIGCILSALLMLAEVLALL